MKPLIASGMALVALVIGTGILRQKSEPAAEQASDLAASTETAVFSGGCFWGLQAAFDELPGVVSSRVGYTGGTTSNPTYSDVVARSTGHAEAVEVIFDPSTITYSELIEFHLRHLRHFKGEVDPSYATVHYRSSIFVANIDQRNAAEKALLHFGESESKPGIKGVLIQEASTFWEAEAEHQNYLAKCAY